MKQPVLSILICSIESRADFLARLLAILEPQQRGDVEILIDLDDGQVSIGQKRNRLVARATGEYLCFVDDDDTVPDDYVATLVAACSEGNDCVGFKLRRVVNGASEDIQAMHSIRFTDWGVVSWDNEPFYMRTPNHLNPIRAALARQVPFPDQNAGEDKDYSTRIRPLLRSETFVDRPMYVYEYREDRPGEVTHASRSVTVLEPA